MRTTERDGPGMKGKEGRMITVGAVEVEVQTTVRRSVSQPRVFYRGVEPSAHLSFFPRSRKKTPEVDISVGP